MTPAGPRPPARRPTMNDVARRSGVSLKTVSRVVNGEPAVGEETAARVRAAIEALGFRRNDGASHLRRGTSTRTVGVIMEDVGDPFYSQLVRAVEEVALARGFLVVAGSSDEDGARERRLALAFCARRVDGLVVVPAARDHAYLAPELAAGTAAVFVDRPPTHLAADAVLADNAGGVRAAVAHLVRHGHRRLAFVGDRPGIFTAAERQRGFLEGVAEHGLGGPPRVAMGPHTPASVADALARLCGTGGATAVITGNNRISVLALRALAGRGRRPALVGFDDLELADLVQPPLTVVAQDPALSGQRAAELLFARLDGERGPPRRVVLPTRLVPRGSGEVGPA